MQSKYIHVPVCTHSSTSMQQPADGCLSFFTDVVDDCGD